MSCGWKCRGFGGLKGVWLLAGLALAGGCGGPGGNEGEALRRLKVVATTSHVADLARHVGGEFVEVEGLMGPGVDPHLYKATARDLIALQSADVILYSGLHLEGRLGETFEKLRAAGRPIYAVTDRIPRDRLLSPEDYEGNYDPHVWFDPELWAMTIDVVVEAFAKADPGHAAEYVRRGESYREEIVALEDWARQRIETLPPERRILVTSHDAYNYFGDAFGVQVVGVQGISTATEAGLADIASMVRFIKERQVPAIFVESSVSPAAIQRISKDSGAKVGGELFSDALGAPGEMHEGPDGTQYDVGEYIGMFRYNVNTMVESLR